MKITCWQCGAAFDYRTGYNGKCGECATPDIIGELEERSKKYALARTAKWNSLCPNDYLDTDRAIIPSKAAFDLVQQWKPGGKGMLLVGPSRRGKTRSFWSLAKRLVFGGVDILALDAIGFSIEQGKSIREGRYDTWLESLVTAEVLFLDDFTKINLTTASRALLFGVVDRRCSRKLPIIATTNDTPETLAKVGDEMRMIPLMLRLSEYCDEVAF